MMVPVRCFTCGKVVGEHWEEFKQRTKEADNPEDPEAVLDDLGVERHCCRRVLGSHKGPVDILAPYQ